jgi:DNA-binding MarR family transcriptional regulator
MTMPTTVTGAPAQTPPDRATLELASTLRLAVMRLARRLRQQADAGVTPSMLSALHSIARLEPVTLGDLARAERVKPSSTSVVVSALEREGLVDRRTDAVDRRVTWVRPSSQGRRLIERVRSRKNAYLARRLRGLAPADREVLERAVHILEGMIEETPSR